MKILHLSAPERAQLTQIATSVLANPFSEERRANDLLLAACPASAPLAHRVDAAVARVREVLAGLERAGKGRATALAGAERELLIQAHLFQVFYRYLERLDALIEAQVRAGDGLLPVPFAAPALAEIARLGLPEDEGVRYFAMFYQLRRAYYFIERTLTGTSPCMQRLKETLWNNVFTHDRTLYGKHLWSRMEDFSTLLLGETGTGKGVAAAAVGRSAFIPFDVRRQVFTESFMRTFIALNLSQFSEALIESELFGHKKGAFTGAVEAHEGVLARCSPHGAIFMDEIGEVSVPVQIKLLQVLQTRTFTPVGSHAPRTFRGRVIAATNRPLAALRHSAAFRDDFFYRLCSDVIELPPLRQRLAEDPRELHGLIAVVAQRLLGEHRPEVVERLHETIRQGVGPHYAWPGNVREVEQAVRRVLLTRTYRGEAPPAPPPLDRRGRLQARLAQGAYTAAQLLADYCGLIYEEVGTYEETARRTGLDRRTVRKYVAAARANQ